MHLSRALVSEAKITTNEKNIMKGSGVAHLQSWAT